MKCLVALVASLALAASLAAQAPTVKLAWDAPPAGGGPAPCTIVGYNVYRSLQAGSYDDSTRLTPNPVPLPTTAAPYVDAAALELGKTYFYVARTVGPSRSLVDIYLEPNAASPWPGYRVQAAYADGTSEAGDTNSTVGVPFKVAFLGVTGEDMVGPDGMDSANGVPDWHVRVDGLKPEVTSIDVTVLPDNGSHWARPYVSSTWILGAQYSCAGESVKSNEVSATPGGKPGPTIFASPATVPQGQAVTGTWANVEAPNPFNWVGIYKPGTLDSDWLDWLYTSCTKSATAALASGSCVFQVAAAFATGTYELRLFGDNTSTARLAVGNPFDVVAPSTLKASFFGITGEDVVSPYALNPDGLLDWHFAVSGARALPSSVRVTSNCGAFQCAWQSPLNAQNDFLVYQTWNLPNGDLFITTTGGPPQALYHVTLFYANGTTDEVDAVNVPNAPPEPPTNLRLGGITP